MGDGRVLIIGAGAAGLVAADALSEAGHEVIVIEARDRAGGRMHTTRSSSGTLPIDLGAEFIHGSKVFTWEIIRSAGLKTHEVPGRFWEFLNGEMVEEENFEEPVRQLIKHIPEGKPDKSVQALIEEAKELDASARRRAKAYVEGFHAAPVAQMSALALAKAEAAAEEEGGDKQYRLNEGYEALVRWYLQRLQKRQVTVLYGQTVQTICWEPGAVEVRALTPEGKAYHNGARAVITLPLGVLQERGPTGAQFQPEIAEKARAINSLAMGAVVKLMLQFRSRFWPVDNFGFLHIPEACLPTWWTHERGLLLTGWAGGPQAMSLSQEDIGTILDEAVRELSHVFSVSSNTVRDSLVGHYIHDWSRDPFTRGAYAFTPVGMIDMPKRLGAPVKDTLFFAGEATDADGDQGTVHGAINSGRRAAEEILQLSGRRQYVPAHG